jgi:hypothetical protein
VRPPGKAIISQTFSAETPISEVLTWCYFSISIVAPQTTQLQIVIVYNAVHYFLATGN